MNATHSPHALHDRISRALHAGAFGEADRLLADAPDDANFNSLRGILMQQTGQYEAALGFFEKVLAKQPTNPGMMMNRAMALGSLKRYADALAQLKTVTDTVPSAAAYMLMAEIYKATGEKKNTIAAMGKAMEIGAKAPELAGNYWLARRDICDWSEPLPAFTISDLTPAGATALSDDPVFQRQVAEYFCRTRFPQTLPAPSRTSTAERRIRLGYISADIHTHATAFLIAELFELHNRDQFEIFCLSYGADDKSAIRQRIVNSVEHFVDAAGRPLADVVTTLKAANLDILVDLKGHTRNHALAVLACRPAPIQIHYLGHPGTIGAPFVDYLVGDPVVTPPENDAYYAEKILRMPHCYQINDRHRVVAPALPRSAYGLPEDAVVLASFNQTYKITPQIFALWMDVMRERPNTVLWLFESVPDAHQNLQKEAEKAGVSANRLHFAPFVPNDQHLARYHVVDLCIDTYPYGGHTTTSDALWVGAPVVTLMGKSYPSRVAASLLTSAGVHGLICETPDDYKGKIIALIDAPNIRARLRRHLVESRSTNALFNTTQWVKDWEAMLVSLTSNP